MRKFVGVGGARVVPNNEKKVKGRGEGLAYDRGRSLSSIMQEKKGGGLGRGKKENSRPRLGGGKEGHNSIPRSSHPWRTRRGDRPFSGRY